VNTLAGILSRTLSRIAIRGGQMVEKASGQTLSVEFLGYDGSAERVVLPYKAALETASGPPLTGLR
jgi:hypothetical protein